MVHLTVCYYHIWYTIQSDSTLDSCLNVKKLPARSRREIRSISDWNWTRTHNDLLHTGTLSPIAKLTNYHATYAIQSESTFHYRMNVKEVFAQSKCKIKSISDCNWTRTQSHLVHKQRRNHLTKLGKLLNCVVSTYLLMSFDYMFLSCHVRD